MTDEESIRIDDERVMMVGRILSGLGFQEERHLRHDSMTGLSSRLRHWGRCYN